VKTLRLCDQSEPILYGRAVKNDGAALPRSSPSFSSHSCVTMQ